MVDTSITPMMSQETCESRDPLGRLRHRIRMSRAFMIDYLPGLTTKRSSLKASSGA